MSITIRNTRNIGSALLLAIALASAISCQKNGKQTADGAKDAKQFAVETPPGQGDNGQRPGGAVTPDVIFFIKDKAGSPIPNITVDFKAFDVTALDQLTDDAVRTLIDKEWNTGNPIFYSDQSTTRCDEKLGGAVCTNEEKDAEVKRGAFNTQAGWVGELSGFNPTSGADGKVSVGYHMPRIFSRTLAVAMRVPPGSIAANLVQFIRFKTYSVQRFMDEAQKNPLNSVLTVLPSPVTAGRTFEVFIDSDIPDTDSQGIDFEIITEDVPRLDAPGTVVPKGPITCYFHGGRCNIPGGPFKVMADGKMHISVKPGPTGKAIKPIERQEVEVVKGQASRLVISTTAPDSKITPVCANPYDVTKTCLVLSADIDTLRLYAAMLDDGESFVGSSETKWEIDGPLLGTFESDTVSAVQVFKPESSGRGTITVSAIIGDKTLKVGFTYEVTPGAPAKYTVKTEHGIGGEGIEQATVPFHAVVSIFDKNGNICSNFSDKMAITATLDDALASVPPADSGWAVMQPVASINESMEFSAGVAMSKGSLMLARVPLTGDPSPKLSIAGGIPGASASTAPIRVQAGPLAKSLLRTQPGGFGSVWATPTIINTDINYFFVAAGYDAAGNYVSDVFSKFYGVDEGANVASATSILKSQEPTNYIDSACPSPPAAQPAPVYCPVHKSLTTKNGIQTMFAASGDPGVGRVLAIPQVFDAAGKLVVEPFLSAPLSIESGQAVKLSYHLVDKTTQASVALTSSESPQVTAGQKFNITIEARDVKNIVANSYKGSKALAFVSSAKKSWGGQDPILPSGEINCVFNAGRCQLPGDFVLVNSLEDGSIGVQDVTPSPAIRIPDVWSTFVRVLSGPETRTYVVDRKGGPNAGAKILSEDVSITADDELGLAAVATDAFGNWVRDLTTAEAVWDGAVDVTNVPNASNSWTSSDIFKAIVGVGKSNVLKFLPPTDAAVFRSTDRDTSKYAVVFQPADRTGFGSILVKSSTQPALVAYPSPKFTVTHGAIEHVEVIDPNSADNLHLSPGCFTPQVRLHDKKHNVIEEYTTVTQMGIKIFRRGVADAKAGNFQHYYDMAAARSTLGKYYDAGNTGTFPTVGLAGVAVADNGTTTLASQIDDLVPTNSDPNVAHAVNGSRLAQSWWLGNVAVVAGVAQMSGKLCFFDGRADASTNYADREVQVELPAVTIKGVAMPAVTSRGAGTLGSTATAHPAGDYFRVLRGAYDHVHFALADNQAVPKWAFFLFNGMDASEAWGVDANCPYMHCGTLRFYFHKHDLGCNFIGPASPAGAGIASSPFQLSEITSMAPGPLGSASIQISPHVVPVTQAVTARKAVFTNSEGLPADSTTASGMRLYSGAPATLEAYNAGGAEVRAGSDFALQIDLLDQYGNLTGANTIDGFYYAPRTLNFSWNATNAPNNTAPSLGGPYNLAGSNFSGTYRTPNDFSLVRAGEVVTLNVSLVEQSGISYCPSGSCPATPQTFTKVLTFQPPAGGPVSFEILDGTSVASLAVASGATITSDTVQDLYGCVKDALGNINDCNLSTTWSKTNESASVYSLTGSTIGSQSSIALSFTGKNPVSPSNATFIGPKASVYGYHVGSAKIAASITSPIVASAETPAIAVVPAKVDKFRVAALPLSTTLCPGFSCESRHVAGQSFTTDVIALDLNGNIVTNFTGAKTVMISASNTVNPAGSDYSPTFPSGAQSLTFTAGIGSFSATAFSAGSYGLTFNLSYGGDATTLGSLVSVMKEPINIDPAPLSKYLVDTETAPFSHSALAMSVPDNSVAPSGARFSATVTGQDPYDNEVDCSGANARTFNLSLLQADASTVAAHPLLCADNTSNCLSGITITTNNCRRTVTGLAYDVGGDFVVKAQDAVSGTVNGTDVLHMTTSRATVKNYVVTPSDLNPVAGVGFNAQVQAVDNYGSQIFGADADLNSMSFTWTDGTGASIPSSVNGNAPILPTTLAFGSGVAFSAVKLFKTQTLKLKVTDNQTLPKYGVSAADVVVAPNSSLDYKIRLTDMSAVAIPNNAHILADPSPPGRFNIDIDAYDIWGNARSGESGLVLQAVRQSGSLTPAVLATGSSAPYIPISPNSGDGGGVFVNLSSGHATLSNVFYGVGHPVTFVLDGTSGTQTTTPAVINFDSTIHSVVGYNVSLSTASPRAGAAVTVNVAATDIAKNTVQGIDTALNAQTYSWFGGSASPAPSNLPPAVTAIAGAFTNGVASATARFYKAESIGGGAFGVTDNHSQAYMGTRSGAFVNPIAVSNGLPDHYVLVPETSQPVVGTPFGVTLTVFDEYYNPASDWTTDNLTWAWSGASSSPVTPKQASIHTPTKAANGATTFAGGQRSQRDSRFSGLKRRR